MDKIAKLFQKISLKDKKFLAETIGALLDKNKTINLDIKKLQGSDFFRLRKGNFRIIFHYDKNEPVIDSIKTRNENTY